MTLADTIDGDIRIRTVRAYLAQTNSARLTVEYGEVMDVTDSSGSQLGIYHTHKKNSLHNTVTVSLLARHLTFDWGTLWQCGALLENQNVGKKRARKSAV